MIETCTFEQAQRSYDNAEPPDNSINELTLERQILAEETRSSCKELMAQIDKAEVVDDWLEASLDKLYDALEEFGDIEDYRFANVSCSQCGESFGPGDNGYSHCEHHKGLLHIKQ